MFTHVYVNGKLQPATFLYVKSKNCAEHRGLSSTLPRRMMPDDQVGENDQ